MVNQYINYKGIIKYMEDIKEYYEKLKSFDWFFEMSEDFTYWRNQSTKYRQLKTKATQSSKFQELFTSFEKWRDEIIEGTIDNNETTIPQLII